MKCPKCVDEGKVSRVFDHGGFQTLLGWSPYYDEDGRFHSHDPNKITSGYSCSNGHEFTQTHLARCPNCDFGGPVDA